MKAKIKYFGILILIVVSLSSHAEERRKATPFTETNPYQGVTTYVGKMYEKIDPDIKWILEHLKYEMVRRDIGYLDQDLIALQSLPVKNNEIIPYNALSAENSYLVNRITDIEYKYDDRRCSYGNFGVQHQAMLLPHYAVEFNLPAFRLDANDRVIKSSDVIFKNVIPMKDYIKKIMLWYYDVQKKERWQTVKESGLQNLVSKVYYFINSKEKYEKVFNEIEDNYLNEIFEKPKSFLIKLRKSEGKNNNKTLDVLSKYFVLENGIIVSFMLPSGQEKIKFELINNTEDYLAFNPLDYLLVGQNHEIYAIGSGETDYRCP